MSFKYLIIAIIGIVFFVLGTVLLGSFYSRTQGPESERIKIAATIYPLYDIAQNVAGDALDVKLIVPPGASPHFYEFSPIRLAQLQGTRIIFAIGHGLDDWAQEVQAAIPGVEVYIVDQGIALRESEEESGTVDPHYWLHFGNARKITNSIRDVLRRVDPQNSGVYDLNAGTYSEMLAMKEEELVEKVIALPQKNIVTFHDAFYYFANNFNLDIVGTFQPAAGEEPTPKYLAELQKKVRERDVKLVFGEPQFSSAALENFARDNFLTIAILDPIGGVEGRKSYVEMMEYNIAIIIEKLGKL